MSTSTANPRAIVPGVSLMYAASVNPPRRAKLQAAAAIPTIPSPASSMSPPPSLATASIPPSSNAVQVEQPRKKRGRRPAAGAGASSRAARETLRKANHSRIEKARRGKINNALEELKTLVPPDFACAKEGEDEDEDSNDTPNYPIDSVKKGLGKKVASEREFKLDILERTVLFVRSLLRRIDAEDRSEDADAWTEATVATEFRCTCGAKEETGRKRRTTEPEEEERDQKRRRSAVEEDLGRLSDTEDPNDEGKSGVDGDGDTDAAGEDTDVASSPRLPGRHVRLPSISELFSSVDGMASNQTEATQLPSPSPSPYLFPHQFQSHTGSSAVASNVNVSPSLSPSILPRTSTHRLANSKAERELSYERQGRLDPGMSCPVGMSYLLTPPSYNSTRRNPSAPTLRLPVSAISVRKDTEDDANGGALETEVEDEDGDARTATLALLQMRGSVGSRVVDAGHYVTSSASEIPSPTMKLSLTPGSLLGIGTGGRL